MGRQNNGRQIQWRRDRRARSRASGGAAIMSAAPSTMSQAETKFDVTFGVYNQTEGWGDRRRLSWAALADILTRHAVGPKVGTCIVPAVFAGERRHKADAAKIDVVFLDS